MLHGVRRRSPGRRRTPTSGAGDAPGRGWYNGYRFAKTAVGDLYNTDMVLYYLKHSIPNEPMPRRLIDPNVRIDYTKLRHLLLVNQRISAGAKQLNGNFDLLRHVIGEGETEADPSLGFPLLAACEAVAPGAGGEGGAAR